MAMASIPPAPSSSSPGSPLFRLSGVDLQVPLLPCFRSSLHEYPPLARSLSIDHVHNLGAMFLGSIYHGLNKTIIDLPLSKLSGVCWFLQILLFSYFLEVRPFSSSSLDASVSHIPVILLILSSTTLILRGAFIFRCILT